MAYAAWSVSFGEQPSAAKWNILGTNDAYFDSIVGSGTAWTSFTPTWTASSVNPAIGNGTISGKYQKFGKTVVARYTVTYGSTTTYGTGSYRLSYPVTSVTWVTADDLQGLGIGHYVRSGFANYILHAHARSTSTSYFEMSVQASAGGAGTYDTWTNFTQAVPATSQNGDSFRIQVVYEAA